MVNHAVRAEIVSANAEIVIAMTCKDISDHVLWEKGSSGVGKSDSSGSFAALRMTAETNNGRTSNGRTSNGRTSNGRTSNGRTSNGRTSNGKS
jgi:hypothetical protein